MNERNTVVLHPSWVSKAGLYDITRFFQLRGFDIVAHPYRKDLAVVRSKDQ